MRIAVKLRPHIAIAVATVLLVAASLLWIPWRARVRPNGPYIRLGYGPVWSGPRAVLANYTVEQLARAVKDRYPDYESVPDRELVARLVAVHPRFRTLLGPSVDFGSAEPMSGQALDEETLHNALGLYDSLADPSGRQRYHRVAEPDVVRLGLTALSVAAIGTALSIAALRLVKRPSPADARVAG